MGAEADVAVFRLLEGDFGFVDGDGETVQGTEKLITEITLRAGEVAWDLNGISAEATRIRRRMRRAERMRRWR